MRKLATAVAVDGVWFRPGTAEDDIPAEVREKLTNPDLFREDDDQDEEVPVQEAPVFGLEPRPSDGPGLAATPAAQGVTGATEPVTEETGDAGAKAPRKRTAAKAQPTE